MQRIRPNKSPGMAHGLAWSSFMLRRCQSISRCCHIQNACTPFVVRCVLGRFCVWALSLNQLTWLIKIGVQKVCMTRTTTNCPSFCQLIGPNNKRFAVSLVEFSAAWLQCNQKMSFHNFLIAREKTKTKPKTVSRECPEDAEWRTSISHFMKYMKTYYVPCLAPFYGPRVTQTFDHNNHCGLTV